MSYRLECARCGRPQVTCYCAHVPHLPTRSRVLVLQHPRERGKAVGTAHMASLCLPHSQVAVGVDFSASAAVQAWLHDPAYPPVLLYPGPDAVDLNEAPPPHPVTLVVVDGTWHQARSLVRKNPVLRALPRYAFRPPRPSEYRIRREPREDYVSTIEALALALGALEGEPERFERMLAPFRAMVEKQLQFAAHSPGPRRRKQRRLASRAPSRLPALLAEPNLVCVVGEANAWPHDRALGRPPHPHELVHWVALRLDDGAAFEAVLAPRRPLSRSPMVHAGLSEHALRQGMSVESLGERWRAFVRPADVFCSWGTYATGLLEAEGISLSGAPLEASDAAEACAASERHVDIRKVIGDVRRNRPGSLEQLVEDLSLPHVPRGQGRGGARLGMLAVVTELLSRATRGDAESLARLCQQSEPVAAAG